MDARILVVEDDLTVAEVVVDYLRHAGLEPRHAMDGQAALEIAAAWRPDLVVLDLMLPGVSGLEPRPGCPGGSRSGVTASQAVLRSCCAGPTCCAWNSTPPACRSRASRAGPPTNATTLPLSPYLWHWLAVTGALFLVSATALALRLRARTAG